MSRSQRIAGPGLGFAVLLAAAAAFAQAPASVEAGLADIDRLCDERNAVLGTKVEEGGSALDKLDALVAGAEKEVGSADKVPVTGTAAPAAPPPAEVIRQAKAARESVKLYVDLAAGMRQHAAAELARARAARESQVKMVHYKQALNFIGQGETLARSALADISGGAPPRAEPVRRPLEFNSSAFRQLAQLSGALQRGNPSSNLGTLEQGYNAAAQRAADVAAVGANTPFFSAGPRAYANGTATLPNGRRIDVRAVERATGAPLFRPVPAPGAGPAYAVNPEAYNRARAAARTDVGGVALEITFLMLEAEGVQGFRDGAMLEGIERTVLVSLQWLVGELSHHPAEALAAVPEHLRYPGGVGRIRGYVLDPQRQDIVLIATPAERREARLDADAIVLGLRAAWKEGVTPFVSLDPSPLDPLGPQLSRIGGVPADSVVARIMLDADYLMKQIMLGKRRTPVASYRSVVDILKANPTEKDTYGRYWFYPKPLGSHSIMVSGSARTVLFNVELQVLSEQMAIQGAAFVSTNEGGGIAEMAAFEFNRAFDRFVRSAETDPAALFARLAGLTDVVTLGVLLRRSGIDYPVLAQAAALPYRRLAGGEAAPKQYPAIMTEYFVDRADGRWEGYVGGGVELSARPRRTSATAGIAAFEALLERAVDDGAPRRQGTEAVHFPVALARSTEAAAARRAEEPLRKGSAAFRIGDFEAAARFFAEAAQLDGMSVPAHVNLAFSLDRLGRTAEASAAIRLGRLLDPQDHAAELIDFAIRLRTDRTVYRWPNAKKLLHELTELYTINGRRALAQGHRDLAYGWSSAAIELWLDAPKEAYLVRGFAGLARNPARACEDFRTAWLASRYQGLSDGDRNREITYALASFGSANCSLLQVYGAMSRGDPGPEGRRNLTAIIAGAIGLARDVQAVFPDLAYVFALEVVLEVTNYEVTHLDRPAEAGRADAARIVALAESVVRRFPGEADSHFALGMTSTTLGDRARALASLTRAIEVNPRHGPSHNARAIVHALEGRCAEGRADMARAQRLPNFQGVPAIFASLCGNR